MRTEYLNNYEIRARAFADAVRVLAYDSEVLRLSVMVDSEMIEVIYEDRADANDQEALYDDEIELLDRHNATLRQDLAYVSIVAADGYQKDLADLAGQVNGLAGQFGGKLNSEAVIERRFTKRALFAQTSELGGEIAEEKELGCLIVFLFNEAGRNLD